MWYGASRTSRTKHAAPGPVLRQLMFLNQFNYKFIEISASFCLYVEILSNKKMKTHNYMRVYIREIIF